MRLQATSISAPQRPPQTPTAPRPTASNFDAFFQLSYWVVFVVIARALRSAFLAGLGALP